MIPRGKGKNKEYGDKVIGEALGHWDEIMHGKTTNQEGEEQDEVN